MAKRTLRLGVIGGCGIIGRQTIALASEEPLVEVSLIAEKGDYAIDGKGMPRTYKQALQHIEREEGIHSDYIFSTKDRKMKETLELPLTPADKVTGQECDAYLLAIPDKIAEGFEKKLEKQAPVITFNARTRLKEDVPLVVPFVTDSDKVASLLEKQRKRGLGGIVALTNCTVLGPSYALHGLADEIRAERISIYTSQSIEGSGFNGVRAHTIFDNVKHIWGERESVRSELKKLFGEDLAVVCSCYRVPILSVHHMALSIDTHLDAYSTIPHERKIAVTLNKYGKGRATKLIPRLVVASTDPDFGAPADVKFGSHGGKKLGRGIKIGELRWEPDAAPSDKATLSMRLSYNNELMSAWAAVQTLLELHNNGLLTR